MESLEQLCLACGLCCDGTLFDSVKLEAGDEAKKMKSLGMPVVGVRSKSAGAFFRQPCVALCTDRTCRIYADRPAQCRTFECQVFKDARVGRIKFTAALRLVAQARKRADKIRQLLLILGDEDDRSSLNERFRRTQQRMEMGFINANESAAFAELGIAMHQFSLLAHDKFHIRADKLG